MSRPNIELAAARNALRPRVTQALLDAKIKDFTVEDVIALVYTAGATWGDHAHQQFQRFVMEKLTKVKDPESQFAILSLAFECWNYFPHQDMDNQCPHEKVQALATEPHTKPALPPQIQVGGRTMSPTEYDAMLTEMESVQGPFSEWLKSGILPAYQSFLTENFSKRTATKHYTIADILCDRLLFMGFTSPLDIRPEFLYDEFPVWWQTHVMFGNYNETAVENSVMDFINFIEMIAGVSLDTGEVATDLSQWQ